MASTGASSGKSTHKSATALSKSKSANSTTRKTAPGTSHGKDAVALLKADHRAVEKLFAQFEKAKDTGRKDQLAQQICLELRVHMQIEEEIFYPTSREFLKDEDIVNEAVVEHQAAKDLVDQIEDMDPADEMFDAKVKVLSEQIEHHVEEEEKTYFPQVQKTDMDLKAIGAQLQERKQQLTGDMGGKVPSTH